MHKKNKITLVAAPARCPLPDYSNQHKIGAASIQVQKIKCYLQAIKNSHQDRIPRSYEAEQIELPLQSLVRTQKSLSNEQLLRKRIAELQLQNNQFRLMAKQCQMLAKKNQQLQEQMLMLLNELESTQKEGQSPIRNIPLTNSQAKQLEEYSTIENMYTEESSKQSVQQEIYPKAFKHESPAAREQPVEAFKNVKIDNKSYPYQTQLLASENRIIKNYIQQQIKNSLSNFETKFNDYIRTLEEQMQQIKTTNQQMLKLKLKFESSNYYEKDIKIRVNQSSLNGSQRQRVPEFYIHPEKPFFNTPESQSGDKRDEHDNSLINIEMDNISQSEHSFGKSNKPHHSKLSISNPLYTPDSYPRIRSSSHSKHLQSYSDVSMKKVFDQIEGIRENLTFLLGQQIKTNKPKMIEFENKIYSQLQQILTTFFPYRQQADSSLLCAKNMDQNMLLRSKTHMMKNDRLQSELKQNRGSDKLPSQNNYNVMTQKQSIKLEIPRVCSEKFEETQRKLVEVIEIMKAFNHQYRAMLWSNHDLEGKRQEGVSGLCSN